MDIQVPQILFQIVNFGIILFVLNKFLYKPILKVLDERAKKVEAGQKAADENLKTEKQLETRVESEIKKARIEARKIAKETKEKAEKQAQDIVAEAKKEAKKAIEKEQRALETRIEAENSKMRAKMADMVVSTTKMLLSDALSDSDQKRIVDNQIRKIKGINLA